MRSTEIVAVMLVLAAAGFTPEPSAGESSVDLADRVSKLEARVAEGRGEDEALRGEVIHRRGCAGCHARDGGGDGPGAAEQNPWPRDFTAGKYRVRSTLSGEPPLRSDIEGTIRLGMPGTSMPAFGGALSEDQIADVVTYITGLGPPGLAGGEPEALSIPGFPDPTASDLSDGRAVYLILGCWKCHGLDGSGRGPSAKGLKSDEGQRSRPRNFRHDPFKSGRSPETVARTALSGLIGTPMPSHAEIMVIPREAIDHYEESIPAEVRPELEDFRSTAPPSADLMDLEDEAWQDLSDENLVALSHYVLSLSRRDRFFYKLFKQEPELEERKEIPNKR